MGSWSGRQPEHKIVSQVVLLQLVAVGFGRPGHRIRSLLNGHHPGDVGQGHRLDAKGQGWLAHNWPG